MPGTFLTYPKDKSIMNYVSQIVGNTCFARVIRSANKPEFFLWAGIGAFTSVIMLVIQHYLIT